MMTRSPSTGEWPAGILTEKVMEWLFDQMFKTWGKQFVDKWSGLDSYEMKLFWAKKLCHLTKAEFEHGARKLDSFIHPPTPSEFLKACRPDVNPLVAYYEAVEGCRSRDLGEAGTWSHPAIYWAVVRVSSHELKTQTYSQIRGRWEAALAAELAKDHWELIPLPMIQVAGPGTDKLSRENATKMLTKIKQTTGMLPTGRDPKQWARDILQREKNGEKLLPIQSQLARQALKNEETDDD